MSNATIMKNNITLNGIVDRELIEKCFFFPENNPFRMFHPSGLCRRLCKGNHWTNEYRSMRNIESNLLP